MAEITATMVKALRDKTGLPMMDCKQALTETGGDEQAAVELLNRKAKGKLETRGQRETGEGRIGLRVADDHRSGGILELRCESAQVAQNQVFIDLANTIATQVGASDQASPTPEQVLASPVSAAGGKTAQALIAESFARLQENTRIIRCRRVRGAYVAGYVHFDGRVGVMVALDAVPQDPTVATDLCQHIAFTRPIAISVDQIPPEAIENVRETARVVAKEEGKPDPVIEKIVEGKARAFCKENALLEQEHVKPDYEKKSVQTVLKEAGVTAVTDFVVFRVGGP